MRTDKNKWNWNRLIF